MKIFNDLNCISVWMYAQDGLTLEILQIIFKGQEESRS